MELDSTTLDKINKIKERCQAIKPLVVIRCITYNHEPYIKDALEGFVMQKTDFPIVSIVHDDASTDNTAGIVREYAEKYPDIIFPIFETENQYSKRDGSLGEIMKTAQDATGAKYIAFCEGDDYWTDPLKLQKQVDFLESHPDYGMCYTKTKFYYQNVQKFDNKEWGGPHTQIENLLLNNYCIPTASIVVRKDIYNQYNEDVKEKKQWLMGDYPLSLYVCGASKIHFINECQCVYRVLGESACHFKNIEDSLKFESSAFDVKKYYIKLFNLQSLYNQIESEYNVSCIIRCILYNDYNLTKKFHFRMVGIKTFLIKLMIINRIMFSISQLIVKWKYKKFVK